jgi:hypothetical protein
VDYAVDWAIAAPFAADAGAFMAFWVQHPAVRTLGLILLVIPVPEADSAIARIGPTQERVGDYVRENRVLEAWPLRTGAAALDEAGRSGHHSGERAGRAPRP